MKKIKKRIQKKQPVITNDNYQLKNFIIIIVILLLLVGIFYLITNIVVKDTEDEKNVDNEISTEIQNEKILVGQIFNRSEENYYVLAYKKDDQFMSLYESYLNQYRSIENSIPVYKVDLSEGINKKYVSEDLNISDDLTELTINDTVLFEIKNSKIDNYYVGSNQVIEYLKQKVNG